MKSTFSLSTGVKSILKSPVKNTCPAGVFTDKQYESAIECVTFTNSTVKYFPTLTLLLEPTSTIFGKAFFTPKFSNLDFIKAFVNFPP